MPGGWYTNGGVGHMLRVLDKGEKSDVRHCC
jgi:hypothetical protein